MGEALRGVVRNVVPFGAFVDVGVEGDGLLHSSEVKARRGWGGVCGGGRRGAGGEVAGWELGVGVVKEL